MTKPMKSLLPKGKIPAGYADGGKVKAMAMKMATKLAAKEERTESPKEAMREDKMAAMKSPAKKVPAFLLKKKV